MRASLAALVARTALAATCVGVALTVAAATSVSAAERPVPAGARAPDLALGDQQGRPFRLADSLARRPFVVVAFYVKAFTGG
ncbi:MAG: hypothetical protein ACREM3_13550 [Candidatus Rokuibacteriota bacterium]